METFSLIIPILSMISILVGYLVWKLYFPSYFTEKGKNRAAKEDLLELTSLVESVKASSLASLEETKAQIALNGSVVERRREIYEEVCEGLRVFIAGNVSDRLSMREKFHVAYSKSWLWASDDVLVALNNFIEQQILFAANHSSVSEQALRDSYAKVVLAMRRDVGFDGSKLKEHDYQFTQFGDNVITKNRWGDLKWRA